MNSIKTSVYTVQQAVDSAPTLSGLAERARASSQRLAAVRPLLPPALREHVRCGALDESSWCLLVPHAAAAAKLRQLLPQLSQALNQQGLGVPGIRIKIEQQRA